MFQNLTIFKSAMAMARHAGVKQAEVARNIANADTPGYRARRVVDFAELMRGSDGFGTQRATRPRHLHGREGRAGVDLRDDRSLSEPNGNSVSLETEMVDAVAAKRQSDRALAIYRSGLTILRASIGRS